MESVRVKPELDPHVVAWRYGSSIFGYDPHAYRVPVGLVVGESPGRGTSPYLPLFPDPVTSSGARLLGYSNLSIEDYMGLLVRENLYRFSTTTDEEAEQRVAFLRETAAQRDLRVLLLGRLVRDAFGCTQEFGTATLRARGRSVRVGWIPHPSGLNRRYNDVQAQSLAGRYVRWAAGGGEP